MAATLTLDVIEIVEPCTVPWEDMRGDDRVRYCRLCQKNVYDLSQLTRADANALLAERGEELCVQLYRRADGTVQTADCTPDRLAALRRGARKTLSIASSALAATLAMAGGLAAALGGPPAPRADAVHAAVGKLVSHLGLEDVGPPAPPPPVAPPPPSFRPPEHSYPMRGGIRARPPHVDPFGG